MLLTFNKNAMKYLYLIGLLFFSFIVFSQTPPQLTWSKSIGGSADELIGAFATISANYGRNAAIEVDENDIIYMASTTNSSDFNIPSNSGDEDIFLIAMSMAGNILWTKMIAGSSSERVHRIKARQGGGCIVVCNSISNDGDFANNHSQGYYDAAIFVYDSNGNLQWSKMYGGESIDYLYDIIYTSDGYLMACGESISATGHLAGTGAGMNWVIKINPTNGAVVWSKTFLGPDSSSPDWLENVYRLVELSNGDIILTGFTTPDFNNFNLDRISVISISLSGSLNWKKKIGATGSGDYPAAIVDNGNGSFFILGKLLGTIGGSDDASNYYGGNGDAWLINLDYDGNIIWEKNIGGTNLDMGYDMKINSEGYIYIAGMTRSNDYEASQPGMGNLDFWLVKTTNSGDTVYTQKYGGSGNDFACQMVLANTEKTIFLIGGSDSNDGMILNNLGGRDLWVVKLDYNNTNNSQIIDNSNIISNKISPNPANDFVTIVLNNESEVYIIDMHGKQKMYYKLKQGNHLLNINKLEQGLYFIKIVDNKTIVERTKIIKL